MKKLLSSIIAVSMLAASVAVPVFADEPETAPAEPALTEEIVPEVEEEIIYDDYAELYDYISAAYDVEVINNAYEDGTADNTIDSSKAVAITDNTHVFDLADNTVMTKEFMLSFDFRFDADTASISIYRQKPDGSVNKQGPLLSFADGQLRTQTGSSSYQKLGAMETGKWYTAELEGKMVVAGASATFRLYSYENGVKTLVQETPNVNVRQFYGGSSNGNPDCMSASNVSLDNVKLISEYPDAINITSTADEINAGTTAALDYTMTRLDTEITKYDVAWAVYDESGENEITDGSVSLTKDGVVVADINAATQVVTVKATTEVGAAPLTGEYQIKINAVSTENEKFDDIEVVGVDEAKAGTSQTFEIKASKNGADVTSTLTGADVVWSIYDAADLAQNTSKAFSIENGVLTIADGTLPQTVTVRASSVSGNVYGSKKLMIAFADSQKEEVLLSDACGEANDGGFKLVDSWDGSKAYYAENQVKLPTFGNTSNYVVTELDVKFAGAESGFTFIRVDGTFNSCFRYHEGQISLQTGSSKWDVYQSVSEDKWYHMEILYSASAPDASFNIYEYNEDGTLGEKKTYLDVSRRNGKDYGCLQIEAGTYVDNVKISTPIADSVEVTAPGQYVFAGETAQFTATAQRSGLPLKNYTGLTWKVLDADKLPIIDESVTINNTGLLTVDAMAPAQLLTVVASTDAASDSAEITVQVSEIITVTNIGRNPEGTKITKLYADKNFYYKDEVVFVIAIKDETGRLKAVDTIKTYGDRMALGSNELTADLDLPADFNPDTDIIEAVAWTSF